MYEAFRVRKHAESFDAQFLGCRLWLIGISRSSAIVLSTCTPRALSKGVLRFDSEVGCDLKCHSYLLMVCTVSAASALPSRAAAGMFRAVCENATPSCEGMNEM